MQIQIGAFDETKEVDGVQGWHWISSDTGAWDGPADDWMVAHKPNILNLCDPNGIAIQAGGNLGMYPKLLSRIFKAVYTFEPDKLNFYTLSLNVINDNVFAFNAAVGDHTGFITMQRLTMQNVGMHKVDPRVSETESYTPLIRIDDVVAPTHKVSLLMLDLEGYELPAMKGAIETIRKWKPVIFAENPSPEITMFLSSNFGYKLVGQSKMDGVYVAN